MIQRTTRSNATPALSNPTTSTPAATGGLSPAASTQPAEGGGDVRSAEDVRASRIAQNLARLDASMLSARTPLQWKGYAWRTFDRARGDLVEGDPEAAHLLSAAPAQAVPQPMPLGDPTGGSISSHSTRHPAATAFPESGMTPQAKLAQRGAALSSRATALRAAASAWATDGVRRRSCSVMCVLCLGFVFFGFLVTWIFASIYSTVTARDPCVVAKETHEYLLAHPRTSSLRPDFVPVLPKIVHQQWKTDEIPAGKYTTWHNKFLDLYPESEYTHKLWTDESARELIARDYAFFLPTYDGYKWNIQRADAARYFVLHKYGGLYADLDYEPLVNFWHHLPKDRAALVESPYQYNEKAQNSLMSSPIGDPLWEETFELLVQRANRPVLHATGPMFLDALIATAKEPIHLLPCENFQRLPLHLSSEEEVSPFPSRLHRELLGRLTPMRWCGAYADHTCQYGKHHNTASYLEVTGVMNLLWT